MLDFEGNEATRQINDTGIEMTANEDRLPSFTYF